MRWISLHLPQLPLEALARGAPMPDPIAIVEAQRILVCDARAWHRGVRPGMKLAAATALAPQLRPLARDPAAETEALLGLAGWASQFTPSVALELPQSTGRSASPFELGGRGGDSDVTSQPSSSPSGHRAPIPTSPPPGGKHSASRAHMHALPPAHSAAVLLLEIEGSLRLFGSVETIAQRLRTGAEAMGFDAYVASAPTPRAATWLARSGRTAHVVVIDDLPSRLAPLPLAVTGCDAGMLESLDAIGAHTVGDLLALPRAGLARRFGQALLDRLDQALGRAPDPRTFYVPPPTFRARIEFVVEVTQAEALLFAAHRLLVQLEGYLVTRASAVPRFSLVIAHRGARAIAGTGREPHALHALRELHGRHGSHGPREPSAPRPQVPDASEVPREPHEPPVHASRGPGGRHTPEALEPYEQERRDREAHTVTAIDVGLVAPSRDAAHLTAILRERLGRTALVEPARAITLAADEIVPFAAESASLFRDVKLAAEDWARLVERLRARLGTEAVHGLATAADHRPERAWRRAELVADRPGTTARARRRACEAAASASRSPSATGGPALPHSNRDSVRDEAACASAAARLGRRPFWLLAAPRRLEQVAEKPHYGGPLALVAGPERIETGWWDGAPCARDYFVARTSDQALLWVYREAGGWFVHGMFG
jgi:protein ImuB